MTFVKRKRIIKEAFGDQPTWNSWQGGSPLIGHSLSAQHDLLILPEIHHCDYWVAATKCCDFFVLTIELLIVPGFDVPPMVLIEIGETIINVNRSLHECVHLNGNFLAILGGSQVALAYIVVSLDYFEYLLTHNEQNDPNG